MSLEKNIFNLYKQLGNSGQKGDAAGFIAETFGSKKSTVRAHWLLNEELPDYVKKQELKMTEVVTYLQNQIALQNQVA